MEYSKCTSRDLTRAATAVRRTMAVGTIESLEDRHTAMQNRFGLVRVAAALGEAMTTTNGLDDVDAVRPDPKAVHRFSGSDGVRGMATIVIFTTSRSTSFRCSTVGAAVPAWSIRGAYVAVDLFFVMAAT